MHRFNKICLFTIALVILTLSLAMAGSQFKNEDTAKDRHDNAFGTDPGDTTSTTTFGTSDHGDTTIKSKSRPKKEPVDWYDKVIITVNPNTQWPKGNGTASQTTTSTSTDTSNGTGIGNYTDTDSQTIENQTW